MAIIFKCLTCGRIFTARSEREATKIAMLHYAVHASKHPRSFIAEYMNMREEIYRKHFKQLELREATQTYKP